MFGKRAKEFSEPSGKGEFLDSVNISPHVEEQSRASQSVRNDELSSERDEEERNIAEVSVEEVSGVESTRIKPSGNSDLILQIDDDNRFFVKVRVNTREVLGMLDCGAQATVAGAKAMEWVDALREEVGWRRKMPSVFVRTAGGERHLITKVIDVKVMFNGRSRRLKIICVPSLPKGLILGIDFWNKFGLQPAIIDKIDDDFEIEALEVGASKVEPARVAMSNEQTLKLNTILKKMPFSVPGPLAQTDLITHEIDTGNHKPVRSRRNQVLSPFVQTQVNHEIDRLLALRVIEPCPIGAWCLPIVIAAKPNGNIRMCLDARDLNAITAKDAYPQQQIYRILGRLQSTKYLSSIDLSDAFFQVPLEEESRSKTAFAISGRGYFRYKRMPFGLCNSGATLCRLMEKVIGCDLEPYVFIYLDDVLICTDTFEKHMEILEILAERLSKAKLSIHPIKSKFCVTSLKYLGYIIDERGVRPDPEKISAVLDYPQPRTVKDCRRFMGMAGWYRRLIPNFSSITAPITDLTGKRKDKFVWTDMAQEAFEKLKTILTSEPILANPDFTKPFIIQCDASDRGMGAALLQGEGDQERVIAYWSQKFNSAQRKYQTTERECLSVLTACEKFRGYIEGGSTTKVITDHASLMWLKNLKDPAGRLGRWSLKLQAHDIEIIHRRGSLMVVADALSRAVDAIELEKFSATNDLGYIALRDRMQENPDKYPQFRLENGLIYKYASRGRRDFGFSRIWRILVPKDRRENVLDECHDARAHGGYHKTIDQVRRVYIWTGMDKEVRTYVTNCETCKAAKPCNQMQRTPMGRFVIPSKPWETIYVDFIGPLPRAKSGMKYILSVVDAFSKYAMAQTFREANSAGVIKFLEERVFLSFGVPLALVCDNGSQFISKKFTNFLESYGVQFRPISRYHPQVNAVEAVNKIIGTAIRSYIQNDIRHNEWDKDLAKIMCSINSSIHTGTKFSPYFINFGQEMHLSGKSRLYDVEENYENVERGTENLRRLREKVRKNLDTAYEKSKKRYDLRSREVQFKVGEFVWKKNTEQSSQVKGITAKFLPLYVKCKVKAKIGGSSYELEDLQGKSLGVFSTQMMKK